MAVRAMLWSRGKKNSVHDQKKSGKARNQPSPPQGGKRVPNEGGKCTRSTRGKSPDPGEEGVELSPSGRKRKKAGRKSERTTVEGGGPHPIRVVREVGRLHLLYHLAKVTAGR